MNRQQILWLFFSFSGRVDRAAYALAGLFLLIAQLFLIYRVVAVPEGTSASTFWSGVFLIASGIALMANISLAAKRLHDIGKPGWIAVFFIVAGVLMYAVLCLIPGDVGPNRFGARTNEPR